MAHEHSVVDGDKHFSIDPATREIVNESGKLVLVQGDHRSERFTFKIPKLVDGHDMSLCDTVQVHYTNIDAATKTEADDVYETSDLQVNPDNAEEVIFSWLISSNATQYVGSLIFSITYLCTAEDGSTDYSWSTGEYDAIEVKKRRNNSEAVVSEYSDVLEKWRQELVLANVVEQYTPEEARAELGAVSQEYVDKKVGAIKEVYFTAIIGTNWVGNEAPYVLDIAVPGVLATDKPTMDIVPSSDFATAEAELEAYGSIYRFTTSDNSITVYATDKTESNIPIQLKAVRT